MNNFKAKQDMNEFTQSKWIAPKDSKSTQNLYFRVRKIFTPTELPANPIINICAESYYVLYFNGIEIGRGPARGTHRNNYYDSYDIKSFLQEGENIVAVLAQCMNYETFIAAPAQPGIIVSGIVNSDQSWQISTAEDWRRDVDDYTFQTGKREWRDMNMEPLEWEAPKDTINWEPAWIIPSDQNIYKKKLLPRDIPFLDKKTIYPSDIPVVAQVDCNQNIEAEELFQFMNSHQYQALNNIDHKNLTNLMSASGKSFEIEPPENGKAVTLIFEFDSEVIGFFELEIASPANCVLDICHNEIIKDEYVSPEQFNKSYNLRDRYILREGPQKVGNLLHERGFKTIQIVLRNFHRTISIKNVKAIDRRYPFVSRGTFNSNDMLLNKIWDNCLETIKACTTDIFTDCPWRERAFWVNDLMVQNIISLQAFGVSELHRRAFRLTFSDVRENGLIPGVCPCPMAKDNIILVPTNLFIVLMLKDYLLYSGDNELVDELLPEIKKIFDIFATWEDKNGLVHTDKYWNFFDWSFDFNQVPMYDKKTSLLNYLYIMALKCFLELAKNRKDIDLESIQKRFEHTSKNMEKIFYKDSENLLADWTDGINKSEHSSQLAHAFALLSGEIGPHTQKAFEAALTNNDILQPELYLQYFIFAALKQCGNYSEILRRIRKYWGEIVQTGYPTIFEAGIHQFGKTAFGGDGSMCHAFATAPVDFMQTVILGITPIEPSFKTFAVNPQLLDLEFAEGKIPTPNGNIHVRITKKDTTNKIFLDIPQGTQAVFNNKYLDSGIHELAYKNTSQK